MFLVPVLVCVMGFTWLVELLAKVGEQYHELVAAMSTSAMFVLSSRHYGGATNARNRFDNADKMKKHCWVLFAHAVDDTVVFRTVTAMGVSLMLVVISKLFY